MTAAEVREKIHGWERGAAKLRAIVATQESEEYDSDKDGCESCFDPDTEEMQHLKMLERQMEIWKVGLAALELYERQPAAVKEDDDIVSMWNRLRSRFEWATSAERSDSDESRLEKAATKAMYSPNLEAHTFMCDLVHIQNRGPYGYFLLPQEFMRTVVRLGLMIREPRKVDAVLQPSTTAVGQ